MADAEQGGVAAAARRRVNDALRLQHELVGLPQTPKLVAVRERRAKAGRPPGARNKREEAVAAWVLERIGDPLLAQAAVAVMPVEELAAAAGCTVMEALVERRLAAAVVLPYLHSRRPLDVQVSEHKVVRLTIVDGTGDGGGGDAVEIVGVVENQEVGGGDDGAV